jgi:hypothetical protein
MHAAIGDQRASGLPPLSMAAGSASDLPRRSGRRFEQALNAQAGYRSPALAGSASAGRWWTVLMISLLSIASK